MDDNLIDVDDSILLVTKYALVILGTNNDNTSGKSFLDNEPFKKLSFSCSLIIFKLYKVITNCSLP